MYINSFTFPSKDTEDGELISMNYCPSYFCRNIYPFRTIVPKLSTINFAPITIFYGGNGSGKSTVLNIIAHKLGIRRDASYNTTFWMDKYAGFCEYEMDGEHADWSYGSSGQQEMSFDFSMMAKMITSDDIFKYMQEHRLENEKKLAESIRLRDEIRNVKANCSYLGTGVTRHLDFETGEGIKEFMKFHSMKKKSVSEYLTSQLGALEMGKSNGENALQYLIDRIEDGGLYLLDEPENSMASEFQEKLAKFIAYETLEHGSQFIIATHSPFLLAITGAKIIDLDMEIAKVKKWWELDNMQTLYQLFDKYKDQFEKSIMDNGPLSAFLT